MKFVVSKTYLIVLILIVAVLSGTVVYFLSRQEVLGSRKDALTNVSLIVDEVSKILILPKGEVPTVAEVSDPEALKDQVFFKNALKGDKVLIYTKSGKAILYRPSLKKVVEVAPISL